MIGFYEENNRIKKRDIVIACFAIIATVALICIRSDYILNGFNYILTFILYPAIIIVSLNMSINNIVINRIIREIGLITYDVYIWHICTFYIMKLIIHTNGYDISLFMNRKSMFLYTGICFLIGTVSHYMVERPINNYLVKKGYL